MIFKIMYLLKLSEPSQRFLCVLSVTVNMPTRLQCLDVPVTDEQDCENAYPGMITRRMFCAGYMDGGRDACNVSFKSFQRLAGPTALHVW